MKNKQLRGAVIGYGFVSAKGHIPAYLKRSQDLGDVRLLAVADVSAERRNLAQQALPHARIYSNYKELIDAEASNLDFIDICSPPRYHAVMAHRALAGGLHVLCEKPLARTVAEARSLVDHAQRVQRVLFPCHNYKHAPMIKAIRELIRSGRIGKVRSVTLNTYRNTHAKGVTEWNSDWRRKRRYSGGGIGMDHGSHSFYLAFDWFGSYPTSVRAEVSNLDPGKYDTEDGFTAVLTFPAGVAHVNLSWTAGARKVVYTVRGEKGTITMDDDDLLVETINGSHGVNGAQPGASRHVEKKWIGSHWADASHASWFDSLFDEFRQAIEDGDFAGKEAREAVLCVELIDTAYRSAREGSRELPLAD